jgi:hypothetical protein
MVGRRTIPAVLAAAALVLVGGACQGSDARPARAAARVALADATAVKIREADGTLTRVAGLPSGWRAEGLIWSGNGAELAWVADSPEPGESRIYRASATGEQVRHWDCALFCGTLAFLGTTLIGEGNIGAPATYPRTGGEPERFEADGLPGDTNFFGTPIYNDLLTGAGKGDRVYVVIGSDLNAPKNIRQVGGDRKAVVIHDVGSARLPANGVVSPDGEQLAYTIDQADAACPATDTVTVVDLTSRRATKVTPPASSRAMFVSALWFDARGTLSAAYVEGPVTCTPGLADQPDTPTRPTPATVYRRTGVVWTATGRQAQAGGDVGAGRRVELTGPLTVGPSRIQQSPAGTLLLTGGGKDQVIGKDVTTFAIRP